MASKTKLDKNLIKDFEPLTGLSYDKLDEVASKSIIEDLPAGRVLFREGERDNRILYLINGQVEVTTKGSKKPQIIKARTPDARQPLADGQPRPATAKAKGAVTVVTVDPDLLEIIMDETPLTATEFEVTEISGDDTTDWMLRFLQSRAFLKLPTENIQAILMRMEELPARKGEVIIRQGEKDDYYYIVQSGSCAVSRRPAPKAQDIQLATLAEGSGFGEEALITNGKRNASITMLEDGVLMRLNKKDFLEYLAAPLITRLNETDIINKVSSGALLIDLRNHEEYSKQHMDGAVNIPLSMLRLKLEGLNPNRDYVLVCADGTQSAAAAFLLTQHGFNCSILDGGLKATNIKLTEKPKAEAAVAAAPSNKRTMAAEKTQKAAEDRARKITQEADSARREAEQLAQQTASAEQAKRKAEQEIKRLQQKQDKAEQAVREKAEQARRQAEQELQKIKAAKQANEEKQKALDESLKRAKQIATEAAQAAEQSRKQAEKEAEEIRRKAHQEAEQLKKEMEETRRRFEQQASQAQEQKEAERQAAIEKARQDAEEIRRQAQSEAERLRAELEAAKQAVDERAAQVEQEESSKRVSLLEEARQRAMELAEKTTRIAEQEAEEIRRKALEEAEQLRQQMEQTRQQVMEHAARAQQEADEQAQRDAETRERRQMEANKQREAEEKKRREAEAQARRQAEEKRQREAAEQQRLEKEREARRQQAIRNAQMKRKDHARRMAEEIKAKLEHAERQRQQEEERNRSEGFSIARATIKHKDGKIILEGDEDIFIFKEPDVTPEQIEAELAKQPPAPPAKDELPSFEVEESSKPVIKPVNTQAINAKLAEQHASKKQQRKKHHVFAIAATLLLALGAGGVYVFMHPELVDEYLVAKTETDKASTTAKASVVGINKKDDKNSAKQKREKSLKTEAVERFDALLQEWKEITSR